MTEKDRLAGARERINKMHNRALLKQLRKEREYQALRWPNYDWVWEQPDRPVGGYHVGPGDPDWASRRSSSIW